VGTIFDTNVGLELLTFTFLNFPFGRTGKLFFFSECRAAELVGVLISRAVFLALLLTVSIIDCKY